MSGLPRERENELILMVRKGRREAFRPIVERYWARVKCLIRKVVRNPELVEDLCQETFLRVYEKLDQFDTSRDLGPWVMKIAFNLVGEHFRKAGERLTLVPLEENDLESSRPGPSEQVLGRLLMDECLEKLPVLYKLIFALRHGMMFSYEEISVILEEPLGTIKVHLHRARDILKGHLSKKSQASLGEGGGNT